MPRWNIFGKKKENSVPAPNKRETEQQRTTLERLRNLEDLFQRKQVHLENRIEELTAEARKHGMKNKRAALMSLRRKKRLEAELARVDGQLTTVELQREALESAKNNLEVLGAMRDAANVLKTAQNHVTADTVLDIMDEVNEQQDLAREVADAMSNPIGLMNSPIDDAELERELEELEQEELDKALLKVKNSESGLDVEMSKETPGPFIPESSYNNPASKTTKENNSKGKKSEKVTNKATDEERELEELALWSRE